MVGSRSRGRQSPITAWHCCFCLQTTPLCADLLSRCAANYLTNKEYDKGLADIRQAEQIDPSRRLVRSSYVSVLLARASLSQQNDFAALCWISAKRSRSTRNPHCAQQPCLAAPHGTQGVSAGGRRAAHARSAVNLAQNSADFLNTLGVALYRNGLLEEAVPILEKSFESIKGTADAYDLSSSPCAITDCETP